MVKVRMRMRVRASDGKCYRFMQLEREREIKEDLVGTSEHGGATVASLACRQDGNGEMGLFACPQ
jgi:hypothetical protein